jgi:hypothetical protein
MPEIDSGNLESTFILEIREEGACSEQGYDGASVEYMMFKV